MQQRICDAIMAGNYYEAACAYGGISVATFYTWLEKGEAGRPPYREFLEAVRKAEADSEVAVVALWRKRTPEDWRACRDFLARRFPKRWGPKEGRELSGTLGLEHSGEVNDKSDEQHLRAAAAALLRLGLVPGGQDAQGDAPGGDPPSEQAAPAD